MVRQQVVVGATNTKEAYVKHGLKENEEVYLSDIKDTADLKWELLPDSVAHPAPPPAPPADTGKKDSAPPIASNAVIIEEEN